MAFKDCIPFIWSLRAATLLFCAMLHGILHAPCSFFDTTPKGRLLVRFSDDVDDVDTEVPLLLADTVECINEVWKIHFFLDVFCFFFFGTCEAQHFDLSDKL